MPVSWLLRTEHSLLAIGAVNAQLSPIYWQDMQSMIYPLWIDSKKRLNAKHKSDQLFLRLRLLATTGSDRMQRRFDQPRDSNFAAKGARLASFYLACGRRKSKHRPAYPQDDL